MASSTVTICAWLSLLLLLLLTATEVVVVRGDSAIPTEKQQREAFVKSLREEVLSRLQGLAGVPHEYDGATRGSNAGTESKASPPSTAPEVDRSAAAVTLPEPPRSMGIHIPCRKFGHGCPDDYIVFLQEYLASLPPIPSDVKPDEGDHVMSRSHADVGEEEVRSEEEPPHSEPGVTPPSPSPFPRSQDWTVEQVTRLEKLHDYVRVLEGNLRSAVQAQAEHRRHQPWWLSALLRLMAYREGPLQGAATAVVADKVPAPPLTHCMEYSLRQRLTQTFLQWHPAIVELWWLLVWRLLPCVTVVAVVVWSLTGGPLTPEETALVLSALQPRAATATEAAPERAKPQREAASSAAANDAEPSEGALVAPTPTPMSDANNDDDTAGVAATGAAAGLAAARARAAQQKRVAVSFSLLDAYFQLEGPFVILKLRVVLCLTATSILLWTLFGLHWHAQALFIPTPSSSRPQRVEPDINASVVALYSGYASSLVQWATRETLTRVMPTWLLSHGTLCVGLLLIGPAFMVAAKGLLDALQELMDTEYLSAVFREQLLKLAS